MSAPPSPTNWITCVGAVTGCSIQLWTGRVLKLDDHGLMCVQIVNLYRDQFWFDIDDEGVTWIRGKHDIAAEEAQALLVTYVLSKPA